MSLPRMMHRTDYEPSDFLIDQIHLTVELGEEVTLITAVTEFRENPHKKSTTSTLCLQGKNMVLTSVALNGVLLTPKEYVLTEETLEILTVPATFTLTIKTLIKPQENTALEGLYQSNKTYCTQCEPHGFRKITYYLDRPDVMALFTTRIEADRSHYPILLSNGNCIGSGELAHGRHFAIWQDPFKKPCYLFALVAGRLDWIEEVFVTRSGRSIVLRIYVEIGKGNRAWHAMSALKKAMRWDEETFGREYDLDIFMIVAVSDFNMGAMENKGLNIFNDKYILANPETATDQDYENIDVVVSHEYFHNWTGNRITCRDWFDLCLKEGLTVFRDQSFIADITHAGVARIKRVMTLRSRQFTEDASPLAHNVRPDSVLEINNFYTATVYEKGAEIFHMLKTILGTAVFRESMDAYFDTFDGQAVTMDDLLAIFEKTSQRDLASFKLWYAQAGTPTLQIQAQYDADKKEYLLTMTQTILPTPGQPNKQAMLIPVNLGLLSEEGCEVLKTQVFALEKKQQQFRIPGIEKKPIPSLLRHFSAPVKLEYEYSNEELIHLMKHDTDDFNHWESGQTLMIRELLRLNADAQAGRVLTVSPQIIEAITWMLKTTTRHPHVLAYTLKCPEEIYLSSFMSPVAIDSLHQARMQLITTIGRSCRDLLLEQYQRHATSASYVYDQISVANRAFKNTCLFYLAQAGEMELAASQAKQANNMTDLFSAALALNDIASEQREDVMAYFYKTWHHDPLVLNKWFSLQATSRRADALDTILSLSHHEKFDLSNPNRAYALLLTFAGQNLVHFHEKTGRGYRFITDHVMLLTNRNPQVASRILREFSSVKRYDTGRQALAMAELDRILAQAELSKDVLEIASKIRNEGE